MFHGGQIFLWWMMGCGRMIHTVLVDAWFTVEKHSQFEDEASVEHIWRCWCFSHSLIRRETLPGILDLRLTELNIICCPMDAVTFDLSGSSDGLINA